MAFCGLGLLGADIARSKQNALVSEIVILFKDAAMNEASEVQTVFANLSLQDLDESSSDDSNIPEMTLDLPLIAIESTPFKSPSTVNNSMTLSQSPTPPQWSPISLSATTPEVPSPGHPIQQSTPQGAEDVATQEPSPALQLQLQTTPAQLQSSFSHQHISHNFFSWKGFKIVGDNLDKTVRPRRQRFDERTKSLHYFNTMAILDRVDMSKFSDERSAFSHSSFSLESLLPQPEDLAEITANFGVLIGRVLVKHVPALKCLNSVVKQHIEHQYYKEMSSKSTVVSHSTDAQLVCVYCCPFIL